MVKAMDDLEESSRDKLSMPDFSMGMPVNAVQDAATCSTTGYRRVGGKKKKTDDNQQDLKRKRKGVVLASDAEGRTNTSAITTTCSTEMSLCETERLGDKKDKS